MGFHGIFGSSAAKLNWYYFELPGHLREVWTAHLYLLIELFIRVRIPALSICDSPC